MDIIKTIFIAIVQGVTEFLPISSSGHIILFKNLFDLDLDSTFDVFLHLGTLLAVFVVFISEIKELVFGLFQKKISSKLFGSSLERKNILKIWLLFLIATIPAGLSGFFLEDILDIEPSSTNKLMFLILASLFFINAVILLSTFYIKSKNKEKNIKDLSFLEALYIGCFQAIAVLPGISRSGSTVTGSIHINLNRKDAGRFSFLLSIPVILAAFLLKLFKLINSPIPTDNHYILLLIIGVIVSFISGLIALKLLLKIIEKGKFWVFSIYMIIPVITSIVLYFIK